MDGNSGGSGGQRFRRIPRQSFAHMKLDPLVSCILFFWSVYLVHFRLHA